MGVLDTIRQKLSGQERKDVAEEVEYYEQAHPSVATMQYKKPIGPEPPRTNANQYQSPIGPKQVFQYKQPIGPQQPPVNPNQYKQPAGPTREDKEEHEKEELKKKQEKFQLDQEKWNLERKMKARDEEYRKEQEEVQKKNRMPSFGERAGQAAVGALGPLFAVREKNIKAMQPKQKGENQLTKADVAKMIAQKQQGKKKGNVMSGGQFHAPAFSGFGSSGLDNVDPFAGLGGRIGKKGGMPRGMDPFAGLPGGKGPGMFKGSDKAVAKKKFRKMGDWFKF